MSFPPTREPSCDRRQLGRHIASARGQGRTRRRLARRRPLHAALLTILHTPSDARALRDVSTRSCHPQRRHRHRAQRHAGKGVAAPARDGTRRRAFRAVAVGVERAVRMSDAWVALGEVRRGLGGGRAGGGWACCARAFRSVGRKMFHSYLSLVTIATSKHSPPGTRPRSSPPTPPPSLLPLSIADTSRGPTRLPQLPPSHALQRAHRLDARAAVIAVRACLMVPCSSLSPRWLPSTPPASTLLLSTAGG